VSVTFTKLFSSITASTIWCEDANTRIVWITMLSMADRKGRIFASVPGLAHMARVPTEACREAIAKFLSPDPDSRTPDYEGRRIEVIEGGWRLLNYEKYRAVRDEESIKESKRRYINERRAAERCDVENVELGRPPSTQAEAEAEAGEEQRQKPRASRLPADWMPGPDLLKLAAERGLTGRALVDEVDKFRDYWAAKPGKDGTKLDWDATFRNWIRTATKNPARGAANDQPANPLARRRGESNFEWVNRCAAYHREHGNLAEQEHHGHPVGADDRDVPRLVGS